MDSFEQQTATQEWRRSWPVATAGLCGISLASMPIYSVGAFIIPLQDQFGWSRARATSGLTLALAAMALLGPLTGIAVDRWGPRRIALPGSILLCIAVALLSKCSDSLAGWWGLWLLVGISCILIGVTVWTTGISSSFDRSRGLALSVALCGGALSAALAPLAATYYIGRFGWRLAYVALAGSWALVVIPIVAICYHTPLDARHARRGATVPERSGLDLREGFRSAAFWKILIAALCMTGGAVSLGVMLIPLLRSLGFSAPAAAQVAALLGIAALAGRLGTGFLLDRFSGNIVAGLASLLPIVTCLLLLEFPRSIDAAIVAVIFLGLCTGSELDATAFLASRHLGLKRFATLYAFIGSSMALATGIGPILVSHVYDLSHSYTQAIWFVIPASMLAAGLLYSLGRTPGRTHTGRIALDGTTPVTVPI